jgi:hypothetical protein
LPQLKSVIRWPFRNDGRGSNVCIACDHSAPGFGIWDSGLGAIGIRE